MPSQLETLIDRAERDLHDAYCDSDDREERDDAQRERRNQWLEWLADCENDREERMVIPV